MEVTKEEKILLIIMSLMELNGRERFLQLALRFWDKGVVVCLAGMTCVRPDVCGSFVKIQ